MKELDGIWTEPLPDLRIVQLVATADRVLVAGRVGRRPEIRTARFDEAPLHVEPFRAVPLPPGWSDWDEDHGEVEPWLAVDETRAPAQLAVTRVEYQGGSWGTAVFRDIGSAAHGEIASTTDADIPFAHPMVLRGDDLIAADHTALYRFRASGDRWTISDRVPEGATTVHLAATPDGTTLVAGTDEHSNARLEVFQRGPDGHVAWTKAIPAAWSWLGSGLGFARSGLVVGSTEPEPDGANLFVIDVATGRVRKRIAVPPEPTNGTGVHELDVQGDLAAAGQLSALWVVDVRAGAVRCRLRLPERRDHELARPIAVVAGTRVVAAVDDRLGIFDVRACVSSGS